jgi:diacylglycerol kinase
LNDIERFKFSFHNAISGIKIALRTQRNLRIHIFIGTFIITLSLLLKIHATEWILLLLTILIVLVTELFNTALEFSIDLISPEFNLLAKKAKDVSAAAVLIAAIFSLVIGFIVFGPKILSLILVTL